MGQKAINSPGGFVPVALSSNSWPDFSTNLLSDCLLAIRWTGGANVLISILESYTLELLHLLGDGNLGG